MDVRSRDWLGWNRSDRIVLAAIGPLLALLIGLAAPGDPGPEADPSRSILRVDPNTAPAGLLEALPGIGPTIAGYIVTAREQAPIRSLDDLDRRVPRIGPKTAEALRPYLRFETDTPGSSE